MDEEQDVEDDGGCLQASSRTAGLCVTALVPSPSLSLLGNSPVRHAQQRKRRERHSCPFLLPTDRKIVLAPESTTSFPIENGVCGLQPGQRRSHAHASSFSSSSPPGVHMPRCLSGPSAVATARSSGHMRRSTGKPPPKICFRVVARRPWLGSRWMSFIPGERSVYRYRATTLPPPAPNLIQSRTPAVRQFALTFFFLFRSIAQFRR